MEQLHMYHIHEILHRRRNGASARRIAAQLGHSRSTVERYLAWGEAQGYLDRTKPLPAPEALLLQEGERLTPPHMTSTVAPYRTVVEALLDQGVELQAILQRLRANHGYTGSYSSVRRFVQRMRPQDPQVCVRLETLPGHQAQVDFGGAGRMVDPVLGCSRPAYAFVMTLSWSRHQYVEFVFDQTIATWCRCHLQAFLAFEGVPREIVIDNLKAAILKTAMEDPVVSEAYRRLALYHGFQIHPCRPRTPQHKGKVENGVHYVQRNFLAGETFTDLPDANRQIKLWVEGIAGLRTHGTTQEQPLTRFLTTEQAALLPLPSDPFEVFEVHRVKVQRDCHVHLDGRAYSVPARWVGTKVDVFVYDGYVQIFYGGKLLATHPLVARGKSSTRMEHYPADKAIYLLRTPAYCRLQAHEVGPACTQVLDTLLTSRPVDKLRAAQSLIGARERYTDARLEAACTRALAFGDPSWLRVKKILQSGVLEQTPPTDLAGTRPPDTAVYQHARGIDEFFDRIAQGEVEL